MANSTQTETVLHFLNILGIQAEITHDELWGDVVVIDAKTYQRYRRQLDAWFMSVGQAGEYVYLTQRLRGTGNTK